MGFRGKRKHLRSFSVSHRGTNFPTSSPRWVVVSIFPTVESIFVASRSTTRTGGESVIYNSALRTIFLIEAHVAVNMLLLGGVPLFCLAFMLSVESIYELAQPPGEMSPRVGSGSKMDESPLIFQSLPGGGWFQRKPKPPAREISGD